MDEFSSSDEGFDNYKVGGYHPITVGEVLNSRYRVERKLGWGHFSTVWFCTDLNTNTNVAVKIVRSDKVYTAAARDEIKLLEQITQADSNRTQRVCHILDSFEIEGPNGTHVCIVSEAFGASLLTLIRVYRHKGIPLPIVRHITKQILEALSFLHRKLKIIHTDLKPENILLEWPVVFTHNQVESNTNTRTAKNVRKKDHRVAKQNDDPTSIIEPNKSDSSSDNPQPQTTTDDPTKLTSKEDKPQSIPEEKVFPGPPPYPTDLSKYNIRLTDFGNSCWTYHHFTTNIQTCEYRAPEAIVRSKKYSTSCDIWSVACIVFEMLTGDYLFDPRKGKDYTVDEDHLALIIELIGLPPQSYLKSTSNTAIFFNQNGDEISLKHIKTHSLWPLSSVLMDKYRFMEGVAVETAGFLSSMLQWDGDDRMPAEGLLRDDWVKQDEDRSDIKAGTEARRKKLEQEERQKKAEPELIIPQTEVSFSALLQFEPPAPPRKKKKRKKRMISLYSPGDGNNDEKDSIDWSGLHLPNVSDNWSYSYYTEKPGDDPDGIGDSGSGSEFRPIRSVGEERAHSLDHLLQKSSQSVFVTPPPRDLSFDPLKIVTASERSEAFNNPPVSNFPMKSGFATEFRGPPKRPTPPLTFNEDALPPSTLTSSESNSDKSDNEANDSDSVLSIKPPKSPPSLNNDDNLSQKSLSPAPSSPILHSHQMLRFSPKARKNSAESLQSQHSQSSTSTPHASSTKRPPSRSPPLPPQAPSSTRTKAHSNTTSPHTLPVSNLSIHSTQLLPPENPPNDDIIPLPLTPLDSAPLSQLPPKPKRTIPKPDKNESSIVKDHSLHSTPFQSHFAAKFPSASLALSPAVPPPQRAPQPQSTQIPTTSSLGTPPHSLPPLSASQNEQRTHQATPLEQITSLIPSFDSSLYNSSYLPADPSEILTNADTLTFFDPNENSSHHQSQFSTQSTESHPPPPSSKHNHNTDTSTRSDAQPQSRRDTMMSMTKTEGQEQAASTEDMYNPNPSMIHASEEHKFVANRDDILKICINSADGKPWTEAPIYGPVDLYAEMETKQMAMLRDRIRIHSEHRRVEKRKRLLEEIKKRAEAKRKAKEGDSKRSERRKDGEKNEGEKKEGERKSSEKREGKDKHKHRSKRHGHHSRHDDADRKAREEAKRRHKEQKKKEEDKQDAVPAADTQPGGSLTGKITELEAFLEKEQASGNYPFISFGYDVNDAIEDGDLFVDFGSDLTGSSPNKGFIDFPTIDSTTNQGFLTFSVDGTGLDDLSQPILTDQQTEPSGKASEGVLGGEEFTEPTFVKPVKAEKEEEEREKKKRKERERQKDSSRDESKSVKESKVSRSSSDDTRKDRKKDDHQRGRKEEEKDRRKDDKERKSDSGRSDRRNHQTKGHSSEKEKKRERRDEKPDRDRRDRERQHKSNESRSHTNHHQSAEHKPSHVQTERREEVPALPPQIPPQTTFHPISLASPITFIPATHLPQDKVQPLSLPLTLAPLPPLHPNTASSVPTLTVASHPKPSSQHHPLPQPPHSLNQVSSSHSSFPAHGFLSSQG